MPRTKGRFGKAASDESEFEGWWQMVGGLPSETEAENRVQKDAQNQPDGGRALLHSNSKYLL